MFSRGDDQSALTPANLTTLAHLSVSSTMSLLKSPAEPGSTVRRTSSTGRSGRWGKAAVPERGGAMRPVSIVNWFAIAYPAVASKAARRTQATCQPQNNFAVRI
jgi:hypothetical protein